MTNTKTLRFEGTGLRLNCLDHGTDGKPPILFLHGGSAHAHWWDFTAPMFAGDWHALALDQRGHGDSEWASEWAYGSRHYVEDLEAVIDRWGFGAPVIVGHSMGGHNAMLYAARPNAKVRAMAVVDSTPDYSERAVQFLRMVAGRPARRFDSLEEACAAFRLLPRETKATPEVLRHIAGFTFRQNGDGKWIHKLDRRTLIREPLDVWDLLPRISCPALVVRAAESFVLDREAARRMADALPDGRLVEIANSYHHVMLDNPDAFANALREFLADLT
jgi:pimeloyl-ACP methyl ester carboxylesterase